MAEWIAKSILALLGLKRRVVVRLQESLKALVQVPNTLRIDAPSAIHRRLKPIMLFLMGGCGGRADAWKLSTVIVAPAPCQVPTEIR